MFFVAVYEDVFDSSVSYTWKEQVKAARLPL